MANTLLSDLVAEVVFRTSPDKTSDAAYEARILSRINWAFKDIAELKEPWEFEVIDRNTTLTQAVSAYLKPIDILQLKSVSVDDIREAGPSLRPLTVTQFNASDKVTQGRPWAFFDRGDSVYLVPTPSAEAAGLTLRLQYIQDPPLATAAQLSLLQPKWDEALVCGAAMKYLRDDGQHERAKAAAQDYAASLGLRRQKKANQFAASGGRSLGIGRSAHGYRSFR